MTVLIDTNIIIDIFSKRKPWFDDSFHALEQLLQKKVNCIVSASAITDIFYILRKYLGNSSQAREIISELSEMIFIVSVTEVDIQSALNSALPDFEDAVVDSVAKRNHASFILTRNQKDFSDAMVPAITPHEFLNP